jgi:hypothetical protein
MTDHHDALDRYLDDLANDRAPRDELEIELVATIDRISEIGETPVPDRTFVDHLEDTLMNAVATAPPLRRLTPIPDNHLALPLPIRPTVPFARPHHWAPILISAALLLLTIGIAFGPLRPGNDGTGRGPAIPAAVVQASPSPEAVSDETLVEVPVPADLLLPADPVVAGINLVTVPVGTFQQPADEAATNPGIQALYILAGTARVVSDELMHLIATGGTGTMEEIKAGTTVVLEPGDTLVTRKAPSEMWTNEGPAEVELISLEVFRGPWWSSTFPLGWVVTEYDVDDSFEQWPGDRPTILRLRHVTAPPESVISLPAGALGQFAVHESDETGSSIGRRTDGSVRFVGGGDKPMTAYIMTVELVDEAATPEP